MTAPASSSGRGGPVVGVLAVQGAVVRHRRALERVGAQVREVRRPQHLEGIDGLVLPGGESTTMALLIERAGLREPLHRCLTDGLPTFGTCAGMILLAAEVLDGRADQWSFGSVDVTVRRNGFGRQSASFERPVVVDGLDAPPFPGIFIRAPVIERCGPGVRPLATVDGIPVLCETGSVLLSAFHPELSDDLRLHHRWVASLAAGSGEVVSRTVDAR